jgi:hypothetical protein
MSLGMGLSFVSLTLTAVRGVRPGETGLASALLNTAQQVGGAVGLSVLTTVAINATTSRTQSLSVGHGHLSGPLNASAVTYGYTSAFQVSAGLALAGLVISLAVIRVPRANAGAERSVAMEGAGVSAA